MTGIHDPVAGETGEVRDAFYALVAGIRRGRWANQAAVSAHVRSGKYTGPGRMVYFVGDAWKLGAG